GAVVSAPQGLAGGAVVAAPRPYLGQQRGQQLGHQGGPGPLRDVGHRGRVHAQPGEVVPGQLLGPERFFAERGHRLGALFGGQVGQVPRRLATSRGGEHKRQPGHGPSVSAIRGAMTCAASLTRSLALTLGIQPVPHAAPLWLPASPSTATLCGWTYTNSTGFRIVRSSSRPPGGTRWEICHPLLRRWGAPR